MKGCLGALSSHAERRQNPSGPRTAPMDHASVDFRSPTAATQPIRQNRSRSMRQIAHLVDEKRTPDRHAFSV